MSDIQKNGDGQKWRIAMVIVLVTALAGGMFSAGMAYSKGFTDAAASVDQQIRAERKASDDTYMRKDSGDLAVIREKLEAMNKTIESLAADVRILRGVR